MVDSVSLQKYSLFGGLLARDIDHIRLLIEDRTYEAGEILISQNKSNDSIFFILEGRVEVVKDGVVLIELGEGATVGEMELLDIMPAAATVRALLPTTVGRITNRAVHEIFKTDQKSFAIMMMNLARDLSRRLRRMNEIAAPHFC
jgi:CRP-like cAMP-binding protein